MPPIRSINLDDGIKIVLTGGEVIEILNALFPSVNTAEELSNTLISTLQRMLEYSHKRNTWDSDHRIRQNPPVLCSWERIQGGNVIIKKMFIAVHVFNYPITSSSDYTVCCQNREAGPIGGDWWL